MPETYRSPYTGTIADLMRQRGMAGAHAQQQASDAAARATMASGAAWGNAVQNIGQTVSGTLADYAAQRADAPNQVMRQRQSDLIAEQLSQLETEQAQTRIGQLAQMVQASNYDPTAARPVFEAIAKLSPDYAEPLLASLQQPEMLKRVTDTLISQTPGYKAPESFTLGEGQTRFDASGNVLAEGPAKPEPPAQPFTLGEGQVRYSPDGEVLAQGPAKPAPATPNVTESQLAMMAAQGNEQAAQALMKLRALREPRPPQEPLEPVMGADGFAVYAPRSQAVGQRVPTTRENPTEDERKSAGFSKRMDDAIRVMEEVEDQITPQDLYQMQSLPQEDLVGALNRSKMSEAAKRYVRAMMQFTEARLRADSGAAVQAYEYVADRQMYGKQYGETPQLSSDRKRARGVAQEGLRTRGGRALPKDDGKPKDNDPLGIRK